MNDNELLLIIKALQVKLGEDDVLTIYKNRFTIKLDGAYLGGEIDIDDCVAVEKTQ